jgi:hypothetical protein
VNVSSVQGDILEFQGEEFESFQGESWQLPGRKFNEEPGIHALVSKYSFL